MNPLSILRLGIIGIALSAMQVSVGFAQEFTFKLHHPLSATAPAQTKMLEPWVEQVQENSGGQIKIDIYPSMSLGGKPSELVQQARDGDVDMIWTVNGYTPGLFPRTEVFELPTVYVNDPVATNLALYDMYREQLVSEYEGLEVMFLHVHAGHGIHTFDSEVRKPTDLAGVKMRTPTRTGAWVIEALGAVPVAIPVDELPQALAENKVDAALIPWQTIAPLNFQEHTAYQIEGVEMTRFGNTTFQLSINKDRWDALPDDIKNAFGNASGPDWSARIGEIWRDLDDTGIRLATEAGNAHVILSDEETARFDQVLAPVVDRWVEEVGGMGIDGEALVDKAREAIAEHNR